MTTEKGVRALRVGALIRRELGALIHDKLRDPRVGGAVVTDVEVSPDLAVATVYIHSSESDSGDEICGRLTRASGFLLKHLARRLSLRALPRLIFRVNDSLERGARIESLLAGVGDDEGSPANE